MNKSQITHKLERALEGLHHNSSLTYLNDVPDTNELVDTALLLIHTGKMKRTPLTGVASQLGMLINRLCNRTGEVPEAIRAGLFVIQQFDPVIGIRRERIKKGAKGKTYFVHIKDYEAYEQLIENLDLARVSSAALPVTEKPEDWSGMVNNGIPLIRGGVVKLTPDEQPVVFNAINRLQSQGMLINTQVLEVYNRALRAPLRYQGISPMSFQNEKKPLPRKGKRLEALILQKLANLFSDTVFYSYYNLDFRGRMYAVSSYLNYQASGAAKGLLLSSEAIPLGDTGYKHLLIHTANSFGIDKVSVVDRISWVIDNFDDLMSWASDPVKNRGWVLADSPWEFLACLFELQAISQFDGEVSDYPCRLLVAADGANNGSQWMAALAKDANTAKLVNLTTSTPQDKPEDLYGYIASYVFETVEQDAKKVQHRLDEFNELFETAKQWVHLDDDKLPQEHYDFYALHFKTLIELAPLYWANVTKASDRRKLVKRNAMTLGYGVTEYGCAEQIDEDGGDVVENLLKPFSVYLGTTVYAECRARLTLAMSALDYFEKQAEKSNAKDRPYRFVTPTNFPMVQTYYKTQTKQMDFTFLDERIQLRVNTGKNPKLNTKKQVASASPNTIHSLDASHLALAITSVSFPVSAVHDSFLCHPSNAQEYAQVIRQTFVDTVNAVELSGLEQGSFNREEVYSATYAFI